MKTRWLFGWIALAVFPSCLALAQSAGTALVRRAPAVNGRVEGSVQVMTGENIVLNGNAVVTGDLLVPGTPAVELSGNPSYGGTQDGAGSAAPSGYSVTLSGRASLGRVVRRTDPVALPTVPAPPAPAGTRSVSINSASQNPGDFATLKDLALAGSAGQIAVPPGTYGAFTANGGGNGFILGVAGATQPAIYNFQDLGLGGGPVAAAGLQVVGPVVVTVDGSFSINSGSVMGSAEHPEWLSLRIAGGGLTLGGGAWAHAHLEAPAGTVTLNGGAQLIGAVTSDRLTVNGNALLRLAAAAPNQPPAVTLTAPADGAQFTAPATIALTATATDSDGAIALVEFFNGATKLGDGAPVTGQPGTFTLTLTFPSGAYTFSAVATDNDGAVATSSPATVTVSTPVNQPPAVALTSPANGAQFTAPATITLAATATDSDGAITKVEFFRDGATKLGERTEPDTAGGSTFTLTLTFTFPPGAYTLTAVATDDDGASATSAARIVSVATGLPFGADFEEHEGYALGSLNGQGGWTSDGASLVTGADALHGVQSVLVPGFQPPVQVGHVFPDTVSGAVIFVDFYAIAAAGADTASSSRYETDVAKATVVGSGNTGIIHVFNGNGSGGGAWLATGAGIAVDANGIAIDWHRLTVRADYLAKKWDLYLDGAMIAADFGFLDNTRTVFSAFSLIGHPTAATLFDYFLAASDNPLFADADKDGLPDAWETAHGLNPSLDDRNSDLDADGLTNLQEYLLGADPQNPDTDGDGISDGQEVANGTNPLVPDNPNQDSDGDGMPDMWETQNGLNPAANDAIADPDSDGVSNLTEFLQGRNPTTGAVPDTTGAVNLRVYLPGN